MKKFIYFSGVVTLNIFLIGCVFKVNHWPGANILIVVGLLLFALAFLPVAAYTAWETQGRTQLPLYLAGFVSLFVNVIAALFKIVHWPEAGTLLLIAIPMPFVLFLPFFLYYHIKGSNIPLKSFLGVMFLLMYLVIFSALLAVQRGV